MTVYGFSDNLTSPVPICMPVMGNPKGGCLLKDLLERRSLASGAGSRAVLLKSTDESGSSVSSLRSLEVRPCPPSSPSTN